jgi:hypothetical protein
MEIPNEGLSFQPPFRIFNLGGGVGCLSAENSACWLLVPTEDMLVWSDISGLRVPYEILELGPLQPITESYFSNIEDLNDPISNVCLSARSGDDQALDVAQAQRWKGLALAYRNRGDGKKATRAERIGAQIIFATNTLHKLVYAYKNTMISQLRESQICDFSCGTFNFYSNKYAMDIGYRTQSCLNELFGLRDFIFYFLFDDLYGESIRLSKAENFLQNNDKFGLADVIIPHIRQQAPIGKLALMSLYRNVFFHYVGPNFGPLGQSYCFREWSGKGWRIPYIVYPLYDNVESLKRLEKGESLWDPNSSAEKEDAMRFMQLERHIDALNFCHESFLTLLRISQAIEECIELESEVQKITEDDIISATMEHSDGSTTRVRRNESGKLENY